MDRKIKRLAVCRVEPGMYVIPEDDDDLTDGEINADWDAGRQDWRRVLRAQHKADVSRLTTAAHDGDEEQSGWGSGHVWALWDADRDEPVFACDED